MTSSFKTKTNIRAGDDDGLIVKAGPRPRRGDEELAVEKATEFGGWDDHGGFEVGRVDVVERFDKWP